MTKRFELPKKLKIGGFNYDIKLVERFDDAAGKIGLCRNGANELYASIYNLEARNSDSKIIQILLHEILHAVDYVYCNNRFTEEGIVDLESIWFTVLAENDLYISYDNKYPESIRVLGQTYNITYDYDFEFNNIEGIGTRVKFPELEIYCSGGLHKRHKKMQILSCIMQIFLNEGYFDDEVPILPFVQGLYQVLRDNKLDRFIRRYCK